MGYGLIRPIGSSCAQRLSASEEESVVGLGQAVRLCRVLNAFRHQRKNRIETADADFSTLGIVLNAFRHQRKNRLNRFVDQRFESDAVLNAFRHQRKNRETLRLSRPAERLWCSTPFGIRGRIGSEIKPTKNGNGSVLNAFRHQRKNRS